jgi:hypothetical protein
MSRERYVSPARVTIEDAPHLLWGYPDVSFAGASGISARTRVPLP